jgi:hypothetical protein
MELPSSFDKANESEVLDDQTQTPDRDVSVHVTSALHYKYVPENPKTSM